MKAFLYTVAAVVAGLLFWSWWKSHSVVSDLQTRQQKDRQNNATLGAYQNLIQPIAQLARVPWSRTNLRMVDPIIPPPVSLPYIPQNGGG